MVVVQDNSRAGYAAELTFDVPQIWLCVTAHQEEVFRHLFSYSSSGGLHFLAYRGAELVSHAMVTTRWLQPEGQPLLKTAYVDAVATLPDYLGPAQKTLLEASDEEQQIVMIRTS